jgi:hypothetical protein
MSLRFRPSDLFGGGEVHDLGINLNAEPLCVTRSYQHCTHQTNKANGGVSPLQQSENTAPQIDCNLVDTADEMHRPLNTWMACASESLADMKLELWPGSHQVMCFVVFGP